MASLASDIDRNSVCVDPAATAVFVDSVALAASYVVPTELSGLTAFGPIPFTETCVPWAAKSSGALTVPLPVIVQVVLSSSATKTSLNGEPTNSGNSSEKHL